MTPAGRQIFIIVVVLVYTPLLRPCDVFALEKYGRPLPALDNATSLGAEESLFAGYFLTSVFATNPTFAARPDNSGLVGLRHMLPWKRISTGNTSRSTPIRTFSPTARTDGLN